MTLAEAAEIFAYWEHNPPPHLLLQSIARLLGWSPPAQARPTSGEDIAAAPPPGLAVTRDADFGMPPPLLDPDALCERNRRRAAGNR